MKFFDITNEPIRQKRKGKTPTTILEREEIKFELFTEDELYKAKGGILTFDLEIFPNYFLAAFKCYNTNKVVCFERYKDVDFNIHKLLFVLHSFCLVGFNSNNFDLPLLWLALNRADNATLKNVTNFIINENWRMKDVEAAYKFKAGSINSVDLIEVAPLSASLKTYGGRLHAPRLQDLPYNPDEHLAFEQMKDVRNYCINDLDLTALLLSELSPQLELRSELSKQYKQDLRSKSDAQIAEAILSSEVKALNGYWAKRPSIEPGTKFKYNMPDFISYKTPQLQRMYEVIKNVDFVVRDTGNVILPEEITALKINIGSCNYTMGIGGLHSTESCVSHLADEFTLLLDRDVASFYPAIILLLNLFPKHLGENFNIVYRTIVERRLKAKNLSSSAKKELQEFKAKLDAFCEEFASLTKEDKDNKIKELLFIVKNSKVVADSLKITINGGFGKFGSKYSCLYSPDLMIAVTITGQLSLLMLIEMIELVGIPIVSGNTDGIVIKCPKNRYGDLNAVIKEWETATGFETEETRYKAIYARDVNNYFAIKEKGDEDAKFLDDKLGVKVKGCYAERGSALNSVLSKNPENLICSDAVMNLLTKNIPIEQTIQNCKDIRRFITLRNVKGGGEKDGIYLGKVVRYYYAKGVTGTINYVINGNKVPNSENAKPCMDLPLTFPNDIDYDRYIAETNKMLIEIGYTKTEKQQKFF